MFEGAGREFAVGLGDLGYVTGGEACWGRTGGGGGGESRVGVVVGDRGVGGVGKGCRGWGRGAEGW